MSVSCKILIEASRKSTFFFIDHVLALIWPDDDFIFNGDHIL